MAADPSPGADAAARRYGDGGKRCSRNNCQRARYPRSARRSEIERVEGPKRLVHVGRQRLVACRSEAIERRRQRRSEVVLRQREAARADGRKAAVHRERHETGRVILAHRGGEQMNVVQPDEGRRIEVVRHTMEAGHQERVRRGKSLGAGVERRNRSSLRRQALPRKKP